MRIGISTASLNGKMTTEKALGYFAENGVECAEAFLCTYSEYTPAFAQELKKRQGSVDVRSIHTLNSQFEPQLFARHELQKSDAQAILRQALAVGQALGARYYVMHGPQQLKYTKFVTNYEFYGACTAEAAAIAQEYGIMLTWENVHWTHYNHPSFMRQLTPYLGDAVVGNTLDIKQARQSGLLVDDYLADMGDRLRNVHVVDFDEDGRLVLPGRGCFDFRSFFRRLRPYDGAVMIEVYDGCFTSPDELLESYYWLKKQEEESR